MDKLTVDNKAFDMAYTSLCGWFFLGRKAALRKAINRYIHAVELYQNKDTDHSGERRAENSTGAQETAAGRE